MIMTKRVPRDQFISPEEDWEADYWARKLGVSRERLDEAVEAVGHSAQKVSTYLDEEAVALAVFLRIGHALF
jgi:hypothetical protein